MNRMCILTIVITLGGLAGSANAQQQGIAIPAGTLLHCTLNEPNFSPVTADLGEPVLCDLSTIQQFGHTLPRGAQLQGHLVNAHLSGHLLGKGSMTLAFDRIDLPDTQLPLPSKIVAVSKYRVNREGAIIGTGHAKRDLVEWTLPILWPWKMLTLPLRGPEPALKGEVQITLRVMDDLFSSQTNGIQNTSVLGNRPTVASSTVGRSAGKGTLDYPGSLRTTLLALRPGTICAVSDYWLLDDGSLTYTLVNGIKQTIDLRELDWDLTTQLNAERGVKVMLQDRQPN